MFLKLLLTVLITRYIYARSDPVHISQNTITTDEKYINGSPEDGITIGKGVYWSLFLDQSFQSKALSVQDSAAFYLTNTKESGAIKLESLVNSNIVAISYPDGIASADVTISGQTMQNNGNLFINNAVQVNFSGDQWENTGNISIEASELGLVAPTLSISSSGSSLMNSGNICLTNVCYQMEEQLYGGGCINLFKGATLEVSKINIDSTFNNTIAFNNPDAQLSFTRSGSYYTVTGFGGGNYIGFAGESSPIKFDYHVQSGLLAITSTEGGYVDYFNIGLGYTSTLFRADTRSVHYKGSPPNLQPSKCGACPSFPIAPSPNNP